MKKKVSLKKATRVYAEAMGLTIRQATKIVNEKFKEITRK